jgi:homoserine kinase
MPEPTLRVRVPGSTSNLGPGFDCLGMAVDRYLTVQWMPDSSPLHIERSGTLEGLDVSLSDDPFVAALGEAGPVGGKIHMTSEIPVARGLGSSAAARVAGLLLGAARAFHIAHGHLRDFTFDRHALLSRAARAEGHPDNVAPILWGGLVAVGGHPEALRVTPLPLSPQLGWAYAAPGVEVRTVEARGALPAQVPHALVGATAARLATLLQGLASADPQSIAWGIDDAVHTPMRLPLIPSGDAAMHAAREAGAWGVAISGSGSGLIAVGPRTLMPRVCDAMAGVFSGVGEPAQATAFVCEPSVQGAMLLGAEALEGEPFGAEEGD